ncbi:MAG: TrmH family RNA methyltransferase [Bacteroidia bacterium]
MISKNQIKQIQALHQKKFRLENKLFLAEGIKTVKEIISGTPLLIHELFATADFINETYLLLHTKKIKYSEVTEKELTQISTQATPNKVLAVCHYFDETPSIFDFKNNFSLYLDDIRDPGNFGTIIRLADWYGISTVFCSETSCELYNPKVIQSTMGAFLRVRTEYISLAELLQKNEIKNVYGAVLGGKNIYTEQLKEGLIIIGNEANGITAENLKLITHPLTIPSHPASVTESLNAAMATAIITSEFFRQFNYIQG